MKLTFLQRPIFGLLHSAEAIFSLNGSVLLSGDSISGAFLWYLV